MTGRPLKPPELRRNRTPPGLGEWVELTALEKPVLPPYRHRWQIPAWVWNAWRKDPVTSQWGPADVTTAMEMAERYYDLSYMDRIRVQTYLGLNPKGKRDLRWRTPAEVKTIAEQAPVKRLRLMDKQAS